jgi:hypothetical protein
MKTRNEVESGWRAASGILVSQGRAKLAAQVKLFVDRMRMPRTEKEQIAAEMLRHGREQRVKETATR